MRSTMSSALLVAAVFLLPAAFCDDMVVGERAGWFNHDNETECFGRLGCIVITDEWYALKRPVNSFPAKPEEIGTTFKLFTRDNTEGEVLTVDEKEEVTSNFYNSDRDTKVVIHGFLGKSTADWIQDITMALLTRMDANVITVDWSKGAKSPYVRAVANTRLVGLEIAYLINTLIKEKGGLPEKFHLIGHSLGAHIAGYAGERIDGLGRITGLDPAGPYFSNMPTFVRLDPSDAKFVDVIHTDGGFGFGTLQPMGDVDFFPNGGSKQPGCVLSVLPFAATTEGLLDALGDVPSCSHSRSELLFLESITSSPFFDDKDGNGNHLCPFVSFHCESYDDFVNGDCVSCGTDGMECALMGMDADKYPGKDKPHMTPRAFYLKTNSLAPYCGYHYGVNLTVAEESEGRDRVVGDLGMTAFGETGVAKEMDLTPKARAMLKGESYNFLGFSSANTGRVSSAEVTWNWNARLLSRDMCLFCVKDLFLSMLQVTDLGYYPVDKFKKSASCNQGDVTEIKSGSLQSYSLNC